MGKILTEVIVFFFFVQLLYLLKEENGFRSTQTVLDKPTSCYSAKLFSFRCLQIVHVHFLGIKLNTQFIITSVLCFSLPFLKIRSMFILHQPFL